jgi:hypothetical protein
MIHIDRVKPIQRMIPWIFTRTIIALWVILWPFVGHGDFFWSALGEILCQIGVIVQISGTDIVGAMV